MKAPLLCALVLATATGAAQAEESSLSLYGVIDAGLINQRVTGPQACAPRTRAWSRVA